MRRHLIIGAALLALLSPVKAADSTVSAMTAASAFAGTELLYIIQSAADRKGTPAQMATYVHSLMSGDCTITGPGVITCTKINGVTASLGGTLTTAAAASLPAIVQGDLWFGSAAATISALAKSAGTSQFIKNSGTSNNPAWARPACADLSDSGTGCSTTVGTAATAATGTSGHTLPFLDGSNTFSGVQTFGNVFGTVSTQSGTTYTLASTDCGTEIAFTNAAAVTVTIPAALTTGCNIAILQTTAAGQVTVTGTAVSAATLHSGHAYTKTFGQWSIIGINIYTTGVAILTGDGA